MLALRRPVAQRDHCNVNVLPCRIHHDGPTKVTKRLWNPVSEEDGTSTSHFRGRRLRGRVIKLPEAYRGVLVKTTEEFLPQSTKSQSGPSYTAIDDDIEIEDDEDEPQEPVKIMDEVSEFQEVVVWGHDHLPAAENPFVKGIEEWIAFSEALHRRPASETKTEDGVMSTADQPKS